ncbi:MAG: tRNA (N6-isopentenyl adenosine(37)-C2)-methylthiotransferase MiaB [Fusobacteriaceae bacterium]
MKKALVITYGCQMNVNESAKIKKILINMGYEITEEIAEAAVVFLNTCTVREGAATQIYGKLGELKTRKEKKKIIVGVTGCFAQEQGEELAKKFPVVDIIMGNQNIGKLPSAIERIENGDLKNVVYIGDENELPETLEASFDSKYTASIPISYGCDNFCTFCIVPYVRGRERSVPMKEILKEIKGYVDKNYKEIILLGQNVNSYGKDLQFGESFARLLEEIQKIQGEFWVRFISPHPRDMTEDVIDVIAKSDKIAKAIHIPLQSGSSKILKLMNRGYTKEHYISLIKKMKEKMPEVGLTTDIIVGFPNETEEDFLDTLEIVKNLKFDNSYMFMYSVRQGTIAAKMGDQIEEVIKKERLHRLMDVQNANAKLNSENFVGKVEKVLVEGHSRKNKETLTGKTSSGKVVIFKGDLELAGKFVNIKITSAKTWTLYGDIVSS